MKEADRHATGVAPTTKEKLLKEICPACGMDLLNTGYCCIGCGKDWLPTMDKILGVKGREAVTSTPKRRAAVLYHNDADGFGSAFAAHHALNETHTLLFKAVQYGEPIPYKELREFGPQQVYILDFSYKAPDLREMMNEFNVVVIDHHSGVVDELKGFSEIHVVSQEPTPCPCESQEFLTEVDERGSCVGKCPPPPMPILSGVRVILENSGCVLSWMFFNPGLDVPEILLYVQDRDLWKWEIEHSKEINAYIGTLPFEFDIWADFYMPLAYDAGCAVLAFQQRQVESRVKGAETVFFHTEKHHFSDCNEWPAIYCGASKSYVPQPVVEVPIVNASENLSEVGEALCFAYPDAPFSITYCDRPNGLRSYSLRSRFGFDVSEVARAFGGNGHRAAAGFTLPSPAKI